MNSGEIIGICVVAIVAVIIIIIYACKCYSDYSLGKHEENVKPINFDNDQELALISAECTNPIPHDPYQEEEDRLAHGDYNDLQMVSLSIEQFIRKETYRKSLTNNQRKKAGRRINSSSSTTGIEEDPGKIEFHGISDHRDEVDGPMSPSVTSPQIASANGYNHSNVAVDAPVIVHHSLGHQNSNENQAVPPKELYEHIYAPVEKSNPAPPALPIDAPTYFRPVKAGTSDSMQSKPQPPPDVPEDMAPEIDLKSLRQPMPIEHMSEVPVANPEPIPEVENEPSKPAPVKKTKRTKPKSIENVPPNEQETTQENLFYVPEEVLSPRTPKKSRKKTERTVNTLDEFGVTPEKPKTKKKKANGKADGAPKQRRRKKSVPELDIAKPIKTSDTEQKASAPKISPLEIADSNGVKSPPIPPKPPMSPPIPPKPQINPGLMSPVLTRTQGNARISQL